MDITIDKKTHNEASIKITLKEADYQPKVEEKVKEYSKKANIKGFRPGKVPATLIKKMYGNSIVVEEVNHLVSHSITDYIKKNNLKIIGEPLPNLDKAKEIDWENQKDFEFEYNIGLVDDFKYDVSKKLKVKSYKIEVDKNTFDEAIDKLRWQYGKMTNPKISEEKDSLYGKFKDNNGEFEKDGLLRIEDIDKKSRNKFIGISGNSIVNFDIQKEFSPELLSQVLGLKEEEIANLSNEFQFTVNNVNRQVRADINQELFDKSLGEGKAKNEAEFNDQVKELIRNNYQHEANYLVEKQVREAMLNKTNLSLPDEFLKEWLTVTNEGKISKDEIEKDYDNYANELKWNLIKNKIAEDNNINVEHPEIMARAKNLIRVQFTSSGVQSPAEENLQSFADNYLKGENGENYMKLSNQMRSEKIFEFIKSNITLTEKKINAKELIKLVKK